MLYHVSSIRPFKIIKLDANPSNFNDWFDTLIKAQYAQCTRRINYYTNRLEHSDKKNRKELRKKISHLTKRKVALKKNSPEEFI